MTEYAKLVVAVDSTSAKSAAGDLDNLTDAGKKTESSLGNLKDKAALVGTALAAAAAAGAAMVKAQIDVADSASKASQAAGTTVEQYTRLNYAMSLSVDGGGDLSQTMLFLNKAIAGASDGAKNNIDTFNRLGVAYQNSDGTLRNSADVMMDVADKFAEMDDGAQKAQIATELFGKSGADLIPMLNGGSAGLKEMGDQADRLGVTLDGNTARAAEQFNDNITILKSGVQGFANQVMKGLLPALNNLGNEMVATADNGDQMASAADGVVAILKGVVTVGVTVSATLQGIGNAIGGIAAATVAALSGDFKGAAQIMSDLHTDTVNLTSQTMSRIAAIWDENAAAVEQAEARKRTAVHATMMATGGAGAPAPVAPSGASPVAAAAVVDPAAPVLGPTDEDITAWLEKEGQAQAQVEALRQGFRDMELQADAKQAQDKMKQQSQFMGDMMSLMNSKSKTLFNIGKAAAVANALLKAKESVVNAYTFGSGIGGPVLGAVFGGIAAVAQAANIAAIKGQSFGGGGGVSSAGGGGGGGIVPMSSANVGTGLIAQPGQAKSQTTDIRLTGIRPDDMITGSYLQKIIEGIGETLADNGGKMGRVELVTA
jgi:hypothetical protein